MRQSLRRQGDYKNKGKNKKQNKTITTTKHKGRFLGNACQPLFRAQLLTMMMKG